MKFPCYIPLVADPDDPRKFVPPPNVGVLIVFTDEKLLGTWAEEHVTGPLLRMVFESPSQLITELNKATLSSRFRAIAVNPGTASTGPQIQPISQFLTQLTSAN